MNTFSEIWLGRGRSTVDTPDSPGRSAVPYSYDGIPDQGLKTFLADRFEPALQRRIRADEKPEEDWRIQSTRVAEKFGTILGGINKVTKLVEYVQLKGVIRFIPEQRGKITLYFLNADMVRAVATLARQSEGSREAKIKSAKEALGEHPLANLIEVPVGQGPSRQSKNTSNKEKSISPVNFDFSGPFWGTPLGENVKEFAEEKNKIGFPSPLRTSDAARMLNLREDSGDTPLISDLVGSGLLVGVENVGSGYQKFYSLRPEHVLLAGLMLLHIERGYSKKETVEKLRAMLEGTTLIQYVGEVEGLIKTEFSNRRYDIFADGSPWRTFPLEPKSSEKTPSVIYSKV